MSKNERYIEKLEKQLEKVEAQYKEAQLYEDIVEEVLDYILRKSEKAEKYLKSWVHGNRGTSAKIQAYNEVANLIKRKLQED